MGLKDVDYDSLIWIELTQDSVHWRDLFFIWVSFSENYFKMYSLLNCKLH